MYRKATTPEEKEKRRQWSKQYYDKVHAKAKACDLYEAAFRKVAKWLWYSAIANILLICACILGWIF